MTADVNPISVLKTLAIPVAKEAKDADPRITLARTSPVDRPCPANEAMNSSKVSPSALRTRSFRLSVPSRATAN